MTSPDQLQHELYRMEAELCRRDLRYFMQSAWHILEPSRPLTLGWPLEAILDHLSALHRGEIKRLLICVPPGSTKSMSSRVFAPVHQWLTNPDKRFIGASYAHHLAVRDNRRAKALIESEWFRLRFPSLKIDPNRSANENFGNTRTGWMLATSVEGIGTGERGDQFIIDDPLSAAQADSPNMRQRALKWFHETVPSRLNDIDKDQILIIMQRLHEEDVANAALELGYESLIIPMHYDPLNPPSTTSIGFSDPRTLPDQLMWPERFPEPAVQRLVDSLGPYAAAAQLEQSPVPRQGGLIETDQISLLDDPPASLQRAIDQSPLPEDPRYIFVRAWDLAGSEGKGAYTVGALVAMNVTDPARPTYVLDVRRRRINPADVRLLMQDCAQSDPPNTTIVYPKDPGQAGIDQANSIASLLTGYTHRAEAQTGSKEARAEPFASKVGSGQIYALNRQWTPHYIEELRFFPKGKYKDQVDASASAFNELSRQLKRKGRTSTLAIVSESQVNAARIQ